MAHLKPKDINLFIGRIYEQIKNTTKKTTQKEPKKKIPEKNIILFVGALYGHMIDAIKKYQRQTKEKYRLGLIYDAKQKLDDSTESHLEQIDLVLSCDTNSDTSLQKCLAPYQEEILAVTCRPEKFVPLLARIIPHVPFTQTPTTESLEWTTDKFSMRKRLNAYDPVINPSYTIISELTQTSIKEIIDEVGFPLIVKPSGMAASRLVSICYHKEELEAVLKLIFKKIDIVHKETGGTWESKVLIEKFMEGDMYSIDSYVTDVGKIYFCPMVHVKTGRSIGFDDFFGYQQMTPTKLKKENVEAAEQTANKAIQAMSLRNTTVHIELMRLEDGWKIIEMGPRAGGFRHMMYEFTYDINHTMNDILVKIGKKPIIPKKQLGWSVAMKFFAKEEGKLKALNGIKKAQELKSYKVIYTNKKIGDACQYAKHGGSSVFDIIMFNKDRSELLADIRRLEQMVEIETE